VRFGDREIAQLSPKARLLLGIVHVPQERSLFPAMSVWDNLLMGGYLIKDAAVVRKRLEQAVAAFPICRSRARDHAGSLSGGEQKQVELARTLILDPTLILLDEPSIGLDPKSRQIVFESIRSLSSSGRTILLVEQNARSGLAASDFGAVLESGRVRLVATGASLLNDPEVARLYLGAGAPVRGISGNAV
jgi:branched-chain amino acid transport system ATP-binding protein